MTNDTNISEVLSGGYMLVDITLRRFSGYKKDKQASEEVTSSHNATHNAAKVTKDLLAGARSELKEVAAAQDSIRAYLYNNTLPWSSASDGNKSGARLIATSKSLEFLRTYKQLNGLYETSLASFLSVYDRRRQQAMGNLGSLANPDDYPSSAEIEQAFGVGLDITPVPSSTDFGRVSLPLDVTQALGARIAMQQGQAMKNAMADINKRIVDELKRMAKQLGKFAKGEKTRMYDSLVTNMRSLVSLLRASNFTSDKKLDELAARLDECTEHDVADLKLSMIKSRAVAHKAVAITQDIEDNLYF